jgi:signal transduction histidine kinase
MEDAQYHVRVIITSLLSVLPSVSFLGEWAPEEQVALLVRPIVGMGYLALVYYLLVRRMPWPRPFRVRFALMHAVIAPLMVLAWIGTSMMIEELLPIERHLPNYWGEFFFIGCIGYAVATGIFYSVESTARAARAESAATQTQLAALRSQLHPHFLFNALHTVVQLIPANPTLAMEAAELVAELLRSSLEEQRDEVSLADEWRFVSRYLAVEHIRFGKRLVVRDEIAPGLLEARVPAFALQTLVENAVRHGAAARMGVTEIVIAAGGDASALTLTVQNTAESAPSSTDAATGTGTGLSRLRERLSVLYGGGASLTCGARDGRYDAVLTVPQRRRAAA